MIKLAILVKFNFLREIFKTEYYYSIGLWLNFQAYFYINYLKKKKSLHIYLILYKFLNESQKQFQYFSNNFSAYAAILKCEYHRKKYTTVGSQIKSNKIKTDPYFEVNNASEKHQSIGCCIGKDKKKKSAENKILTRKNIAKGSHNGSTIDSQQKAFFEIKNIADDVSQTKGSFGKEDLNKITKL